jgi:hypothetical protein
VIGTAEDCASRKVETKLIGKEMGKILNYISVVS